MRGALWAGSLDDPLSRPYARFSLPSPAVADGRACIEFLCVLCVLCGE